MKNEELRMKKLLKKTLKLILPIVLGGFILYWVYRDFDFAEAGEVLRHGTNWWWMLFSLLECLPRCSADGGGGRRWNRWMLFPREVTA